jgi:hypothetical protein
MHRLFLFFVLLIFSCNNTKSLESEVLPENVELPSSGLQLPVLSEEARDALVSWQRFQEFENDLKRINTGSLTRFSAESERMAVAVDTLQNTIPEALNTTIISSRMRVVNTRVKLLHEVLHQRGSDSLVLLANLKETNIAFVNLLAQIQAKFEKQRIDKMARTDENIEANKRLQTNDSI